MAVVNVESLRKINIDPLINFRGLKSRGFLSKFTSASQLNAAEDCNLLRLHPRSKERGFVEAVIKSVRGLLRVERDSQINPLDWQSIWHLGIPGPVIFETVGRYFKYTAAVETLVKHDAIEAARVWHKQARKDFLDYLYLTPQSREVYNRLRQTSMFTVGPKETLTEKFGRLIDSIAKGRDRILRTVDRL